MLDLARELAQHRVADRGHLQLHAVLPLLLAEHAAIALGRGIEEVGEARLAPRHLGDPGRALQVARNQLLEAFRWLALGQDVEEYLGLERCRGHPLSVGGIEAAQCVAEREQPRRQRPQALVVPEAVGGIDHARDRGGEARLRELFEKRRLGQGLGEVEHALAVSGRIVPGTAAHRADVEPALDR